MKQPPKRRIVFLTLDDPTDFVIDDDLAVPALAELGWHVDSVSWRADACWNDWDAVLIRTPWDYQDDPDAFLAVLETIDASSARLENPLETVRWNLRKTYLRDLETRGVLIVPTVWGLDEPPTVDSLRGVFDATELQSEFDSGRRGIVVKPVVSANADDTFPVTEEASDEELETIARTFLRADGTLRPYMIQPFVKSVVEEGEVSLFYFGGERSHAILKTPKSGDFRVQEEHGGRITALEKGDPRFDAVARRRIDERGAAAMAALDPAPLYARVDLVRTADDDFAVMEVELIEPSLYFRMHPDAPRNFARAVDRWLR